MDGRDYAELNMSLFRNWIFRESVQEVVEKSTVWPSVIIHVVGNTRAGWNRVG
jgi:hypothetical protein